MANLVTTLKLQGWFAVILIVGFIIFVAITGGCNKFLKSHETESDCAVTCTLCTDLTVKCEHDVERERNIKINTQ